jgi:hypothetical protein
MFRSRKRTSFKENIDEEKQQNITKLIEEIRQNIQSNDFESLKSSVENLKQL